MHNLEDCGTFPCSTNIPVCASYKDFLKTSVCELPLLVNVIAPNRVLPFMSNPIPPWFSKSSVFMVMTPVGVAPGAVALATPNCELFLST